MTMKDSNYGKAKHMLSLNVIPALSYSREYERRFIKLFKFSSFGSITSIYTIHFSEGRLGCQTKRTVETCATPFHYIWRGGGWGGACQISKLPEQRTTLKTGST